MTDPSLDFRVVDQTGSIHWITDGRSHTDCGANANNPHMPMLEQVPISMQLRYCKRCMIPKGVWAKRKDGDNPYEVAAIRYTERRGRSLR